MSRTKTFRVLAAGVLLGLMAIPVRSETLTDALIDAYRNSNLLEQNEALLRATDENVAIAMAGLRPTIAFSTLSQYSYAQSAITGQRIATEGLDTTFALTAQMVLFDFGRTQFAVEAAKETVLATRQSLLSIEQQVLLAAVSAFVDVRLQEAIVELRQNNVRVIGEQLRAAQDRFEVGEVTRTDVAQAESSLAQAQSGLVAAQGDLSIARENYKAAVGHYPGVLTAPPAPPPAAATLDQAKSVARREHPLVRQSQHQVAASELNVQRAKSQMKPSFNGTAQLSTDQDGFQQNGVGLGFSQTLYAGGSLAATLRQAMANRDANRSNLLQTGVVVEQNVGTVWSNLEVADATVQSTIEQINAAQVAFEGVKEEASLGARTTLDVLNAEQDLLDARNLRLQAEASRYTGVYQLLSAMGLLTVEHLGLGIPTYDPAAYYNAVRKGPAHSAQGKKLERIMKSIGKN
ncbi:MAG: transporter [Cereibacter sphaeroides]|uniref:Transporter n=1 Tax=Cereibacter sphaeroides TaxID=1063 RepID=A0A2W5SL20_CERSP|nr:MAG: transporter [Cereibacter sphaeroides]